jgi:hypothetical protein
MSFLKKLFGKKGNDKPEAGPMPTRALNLQFTLTPDNGHRFAQQFVDAVKNNEKVELNYSIETLEFVDKFLQRFRDEGLTVNDFAETIFVAGAYVGEVMIRNNDGKWLRMEDANLPDGITMTQIVVKLPNDNITDPIAKAFKRFHYGDSDNVTYFYHVFTTGKPEGKPIKN